MQLFFDWYEWAYDSNNIKDYVYYIQFDVVKFGEYKIRSVNGYGNDSPRIREMADQILQSLTIKDFQETLENANSIRIKNLTERLALAKQQISEVKKQYNTNRSKFE